MADLETLYQSCSSLQEVCDLYLLTKHNVDSYQFAKSRIEELRNENDPMFPEGEPSEWYSIRKIRSVHNRKFSLWGTDFELKVVDLPLQGLEQIFPAMMLLFEHIFAEITDGAARDDLLRVVFQSEQLDRPISIRTTRKEELNAEMFFDACVTVLQSYEEFRLDSTVRINVIRIPAMTRIGKGRHVDYEVHLRSKRSLISIRSDDDGLCFGRAVVVGKALCDGLACEKDKRKWRSISRCDKRYTEQFHAALRLYSESGVTPGPVCPTDIQKFQSHLTAYQIVVYNNENQKDILFKGPES